MPSEDAVPDEPAVVADVTAAERYECPSLKNTCTYLQTASNTSFSVLRIVNIASDVL